MTPKEKLNSLLRLRLIFSTEKELSAYIGYQLKGNHFNRFKEFQSDAYFSKFSEMCLNYSNSKVDLARLLEQYRTVSVFYKRWIDGTSRKASPEFIMPILLHIYKCEHLVDCFSCKELMLYEKFKQTVQTHNDTTISASLLLLMAYGLIPTYNNKSSQDVADIIGDFQAAYDILRDIEEGLKPAAYTRFEELPCLKTMRRLIEEERAGDKFLCRLRLIIITQDALNRIFAMLNPARIHDYTDEILPMSFTMPRFMYDENEPENCFYEFERNSCMGYNVYHRSINREERTIHSSRYQVIFEDIDERDVCRCIIMRPNHLYYTVLQEELPTDCMAYEYTDFAYKKDTKEVAWLSFEQDSFVQNKPLKLKAVEREELLKHYQKYCDNADGDITFISNHPQYDVKLEVMKVAITDDALLFLIDGKVYKLQKYDEEDIETVEGISAITNSDNFVFATLYNKGKEQHFICLDNINRSLELEELKEQPFFFRIDSVADMF